MSGNSLTTYLPNLLHGNASNATVSPWAWDPEFEAIVHPYWRSFERVPEVYHYLVGCYISIVGISGVLGNLLVLYIYGTNKTLRTPANLFIMNLAIGDLTFSAVNGFPLLTISSFNTRWAWGKLTCELYGFIGGLFGFISLNTMVLISLDRYFVIAQPFQSMKSLTMKRAVISIILVWLYSLVWSTPPFFGFGSYVPEGFQTSCTFDYLTQSKGNIIFNIGMYICNFVLPVSIIIFSYYQIVKAVRMHELEMLKMAQKMNATNPHAMKTGAKKADIQAAKISIIIVVLYMLSWTPYAIIALMALTGRRDHLTPYTSELPVLFAKTSAMYNPFVYAINHPKFRLVLEKKFPCLICCCPPKPKERDMTSAASATKPSRYHSEKESSVSQLDSDAPVDKQENGGGGKDNAGESNKAYEADH